MFERLIAKVIQILNSVTKKLDKAYLETFGDRATKDGEYLSYEFFDEVDARRAVNKDLYIRQAAIFVGKKVLQEDGYILPPMQAIAIAEEMFKNALNNPNIDKK